MRQSRIGAGFRRMRSERGVRTFSDHSRNTLDLSVIPPAKRLSHLPILVDPSHGTGKRNKVAPMSRASIASTTADVQARVAAYLTDGGLNAGLATTAVNAVAIPVNPSGTVTASGNQVVVQYPYQFRCLAMMNVFFGSSFGTVTLTASSMMRSELL